MSGTVIQELGDGALPRFGDQFVDDEFGGSTVSNRVVWLSDPAPSPASTSGLEGRVRTLDLPTSARREFGTGTFALFREDVLTVLRPGDRLVDIDLETGAEREPDGQANLADRADGVVRNRVETDFDYSVQMEVTLSGHSLEQMTLVIPSSEQMVFGFRSAIAAPVAANEVIVLSDAHPSRTELYLVQLQPLTVRHLGTTLDLRSIVFGPESDGLTVAWDDGSAPGERTLIYSAASRRLTALVGVASPSHLRDGILFIGPRAFISGTLATAAIDLPTFEYLWTLPHAGTISSDGRFVAIAPAQYQPGVAPTIGTPEPVRGEPRPPGLPTR